MELYKRKFLLEAAKYLSLSAILFYLSTVAYVLTGGGIDNKVPSDAIVVLGSSLGQDINNPDPCVNARVDHAVELWKQGYAPKIIFTGGFNTDTGRTNADGMAQLALKQGVPTQVLIKEEQSHFTDNNLRRAQEIMKQEGMNNAIIVTERYHSARGGFIANKLGINFTLSPVDSLCSSQFFGVNQYSLRDAGALDLFILRGEY